MSDAEFLGWLAAMVALMMVVVGLVLWSDRATLREDPIPRSTTAQQVAENRRRVELPTVVLHVLHAAPAWPPTVEQAHETMQLHRGCAPDRCPRKRAAIVTLVKAGHMRPRSRMRVVAR